LRERDDAQQRKGVVIVLWHVVLAGAFSRRVRGLET
jgi:hypothetical protein